MANKVLLAYVAADAVFVITGAILLGYSLINQNTVNEAPKEGVDAATKLLTKQFPLTGTYSSANAMVRRWAYRGNMKH